MADENPDLIYIPNNVVEFCTNKFTNVRVILQYDNTPMLEMVREQKAGFTTQIPIYRSDGSYIAKAVGSRLVYSHDSKAAGIKLRREPYLTVCEMDGKPIFEIRRLEPSRFKTEAELYTHDGSFLKSSDHGLTGKVRAIACSGG
jgi:hypothetical protein